jgi:hypothetical protein
MELVSWPTDNRKHNGGVASSVLSQVTYLTKISLNFIKRGRYKHGLMNMIMSQTYNSLWNKESRPITY